MIEQREVAYAKELGEVAKLLVEIVKVAKSEPKEWGSLIDDLVVAVEGAQNIPAEFKENRSAAIGTCVYELLKIIDELS